MKVQRGLLNAAFFYAQADSKNPQNGLRNTAKLLIINKKHHFISISLQTRKGKKIMKTFIFIFKINSLNTNPKASD
ncbi:hypothetical protein D3M96_10930 [Alcaligenes aquatilis]|jgi:hypothetical protein|uniref:Uncharacterized protein n=1 Tax=Alcaligenes aquatilis TaxID=323284 RepID=A0A3G2HVB6_9BURK|nr:hypothetical protein D3M96_10930 [Alcaligenes aquatilis]